MVVTRRLALSLCLAALASGCASLQARAQVQREELVAPPADNVPAVNVPADAPPAEEPPPPGRRLGGLLRPGAPTFGGGFTWSDEVVYDGWRIQKHSVIGHYRLIDPQDRRQAFGSYETCLAALEAAKVDHQLKPYPKHVVIVLHGLGASRGFMDGLADYLQDEGGYAVINVGYPSTMADIGAYANSLDNIIRHLDGAETADFVAHSMGNIVIRRYLGDMKLLTPAMKPAIKFQRFVMISPPNHGAEIADYVNDHEIMRSLADLMGGKPVDELAPNGGWPTIDKTLATPDFEFGIIVGGKGDDDGYLPQIPGDDDGLLSVATARLAGAVDFVQVKNGIHQFMPKYKVVRELTLSFLQHGYFTTAQERQPIQEVAEAEPVATPAVAAPPKG